jgi:hypothetical protein
MCEVAGGGINSVEIRSVAQMLANQQGAEMGQIERSNDNN